MKRAIGCVVGVGLAASACGGEDCKDGPYWFSVDMPPKRYVSLDRAPADAGRIEEIEGTDRDAGRRTVRVVYGTREEWMALPCAEACSRARDLDLSPNHVVTSCDRTSLRNGDPVVRCFYEHRECWD